MNAITICPLCKDNLETNCRACIDNKSAECFNHGKNPKTVSVKWKVYPQTEEEYMELENGSC